MSFFRNLIGGNEEWTNLNRGRLIALRKRIERKQRKVISRNDPLALYFVYFSAPNLPLEISSPLPQEKVWERCLSLASSSLSFTFSSRSFTFPFLFPSRLRVIKHELVFSLWFRFFSFFFHAISACGSLRARKIASKKGENKSWNP